MAARFSQEFFDVPNIKTAMERILTAEDSTTEERWRTETPYLGDLIMEHLALSERHLVIDYGCGIGRLSKAMIDRSGCKVLGVDTSVRMQALAPVYVQSNRFFACHPEMLCACHDAHYAIAVWALQHIPGLDDAIQMIQKNLRSAGKLFVVNMHKRSLPMSEGPWLDDGLDMREHLSARFQEIAYGSLEADRTTPRTARASFWGVYQRRT